MAYTENFCHQFGIDTISIASTGDKAGFGVFDVPHVMVILTYTVRVANTDLAVIAFDKIPANAGTRGNGDVGTITVPANPVLGKTYYKVINVRLIPGDVVMAEVTDAGAAGSGHIGMRGFRDVDVVTNQTHMIASV